MEFLLSTCHHYNYYSSIGFISLKAIIHPDTGEKIFMPCRMSGKDIGLGSGPQVRYIIPRIICVVYMPYLIVLSYLIISC